MGAPDRGVHGVQEVMGVPARGSREARRLGRFLPGGSGGPVGYGGSSQRVRRLWGFLQGEVKKFQEVMEVPAREARRLGGPRKGV